MTKPIAEIWWDNSNDCNWQLKMLCEPCVSKGTRIPLGWMNEDFNDRFPLKLSEVFADDDIVAISNDCDISLDLIMRIVRRTEALHGIK